MGVGERRARLTGDEHDTPAPLLPDHLPRHRLRTYKRSSSIDVHGPSPLLRLHVQRMHTPHNARVANKNIEPAEHPTDLTNPARDLVRLRDVHVPHDYTSRGEVSRQLL